MPPSFPSTLPQSPAPQGGVRLFRVGTLVYTRTALLQMMFWMLWGGFFFSIMEWLVPSVLPLQLRWEGAGNALIGAVSQSLPAVIGIFLNPVVSVQSDRHRGILGRRRPFLLWGVPPLVLSLVLMGAAKPLGNFIGGGFQRMGWELSTAQVTVALMAFCAVVFGIFNVYVNQIYNYLFADVIPAETMGRFIGAYRAFGAVGGFAFNRWAFGFAQTRTLEIYGWIAVLFAAAFFLLVWRVKEGEYGPPARESVRGLGLVRIYARECYSHPFYWAIYLIPLFFWSTTVPLLTFVTFFATSAGKPGYAPTLGLSLGEFGQIKSWTFLVQIPVYFAIGPIVDRFHPLRVSIAGLFLTSLSLFCSYAFIKDSATLQLWWCMFQVTSAIEIGAYFALLPRLLPLEKYGQFFTANQIVGFLGVVLGPVLSGMLIDAKHDYRQVFVWCGVSCALGFASSVALYVQWKRLGGDGHFAPPG